MLLITLWRCSSSLVFSQELDGFFNWNEIIAKCEEYAQNHDFITQGFLKYPTAKGLNIPYVTISDAAGLPEEDRKAIVIVGGSDTSPIGPSMIFYIIDKLIENYQGDIKDTTTLLKTNKIVIVPMLNADSYNHLGDLWDTTSNRSLLISPKNRNDHHQ